MGAPWGPSNWAGSVTEDGMLVCGCLCADTQGGCPEPSGSRAHQAFHKYIGAVVKTMGSEKLTGLGLNSTSAAY